MAEFFDVRSEIVAFWAGFLAASLFWWLIRRVRPLLPRLRAGLKARWQSLRRKTHDRVDAALRQNTLRRAQAMHLAAPLFPLDDVLVEPLLIAPPVRLTHPTAAPAERILDAVVPYLPDWPHFTAQYGVPAISAAHALERNSRIVVIGQPGSGKSVTLAHLASQMARQPSPAALPVLLHAVHLPLDAPATDPLETLVRALQNYAPRWAHPQLARTLRFLAASGQITLLLDGLDELPAEDLPVASAYLVSLAAAFPAVKIITTAAPDHMDGLLAGSFQPLGVRAWTRSQLERFIQRWGQLWSNQASARTGPKNAPAPEPVDARLLNQWLLSGQEVRSPLEWTLRAWGLYAGDVRGADTLSEIEAHLRRLSQDQVPLEAMSALAREFVAQNRLSLPYSQLDGVLARLKLTAPASDARPGSKKAVRSGAVAALLNAGVLLEHPGEQIRFAHPVFTGLLAAHESDPALAAALPGEHCWPVADETCRFLAAQDCAAEILQRMLAEDDAPLYPNLLRIARWLKDAPLAAPWRSGVLRRLVTLIQRDGLPLALRARFLSAILAASDPSTGLLLKQFTTHDAPSVRQLAALAAGGLDSDKLFDDLIRLIDDSAPEVRAAALVAISASQTPRAVEVMQSALLYGEETLQLAAAEVLARSGQRGHETLRSTLSSDQLLARRAAVLGLAEITEPWADALLEKVAIEDAQWAVRNAAGMALEQARTTGDLAAPAPLPRPPDAPWLIRFASNQGMGIPPDKLPIELLLQALQAGSPEEKLAALTYLRLQPDAPVIAAIRACAEQPAGDLREAAYYALWVLASGGANLHPPQSPLY